VIAVGLGIVVAAAVGLFVATRPPPRGSAPPVASGPSAAAPAPAAPSAAVPPSAGPPPAAAVPGSAAPDSPPPARPAAPVAVVGVAVRTEPDTAHLEIDGQPVSNPYAKALARDPGSHTIRASLPGFVTATEAVTFDRDRELVLRLGRAPDNAAAATRPAASTKPHASGATRPRGPDRLATPLENNSIHAKAPGYRGSKLNIETEFPGAN